jgi:hypothetical protein
MNNKQKVRENWFRKALARTFIPFFAAELINSHYAARFSQAKWTFNIQILLTLLTLNNTLSGELLFHYNFDGDQPHSHIVTDHSGYMRHANAFEYQTGTLIESSAPFSFGVTGIAGDYAFDNTEASGMGGFNNRGGAIKWSGSDLETLRSFTISFWYKTPKDVSAGGGARVAFLGNESEFIDLRFGPDNTAQLVSTGNSQRFSELAFAGSGQWTFFAVTFDADAPADQRIRFYRGGPNFEVFPAGIRGSNLESINFSNSPVELIIGSFQSGSGQAPFKAMLDDFRIFGSSDGSAGALAIQELEDLRRSIANTLTSDKTDESPDSIVEIIEVPIRSIEQVDRRLRARGVTEDHAKSTLHVFHRGALIMELRNQQFIRFRSRGDNDLWIATEHAPMDLAWSYQDVNDFEVKSIDYGISQNNFEILLEATKPSVSGNVHLKIEGVWDEGEQVFNYSISSSMDADLEKWWQVSRWAQMGAYTSGLPGASLDAFDYHINRVSTPDLLQNNLPLSQIAYDYFLRSDDGVTWTKWPKLHVSFTTRPGDYLNLNMNSSEQEGGYFGFVDQREGGWMTRLMKAPDTPDSRVTFMLCWFYMDVHFLLRNAVPPRGTAERFTLDYEVTFHPLSASKGNELVAKAEELPWREMEEFRLPVFTRNNRFDQLISGTRETQWAWFASSWDCKWDDTLGFDDNYSVKIKSADSGPKAWYAFTWGFPKDEEPIGGKNFELTAKVRTEGVSDSARIVAVIDNPGENWVYARGSTEQRGTWIGSEKVNGTNDWQKLTVSFTVRGSFPIIVLEQIGSGTTWFDNVEIRPVP